MTADVWAISPYVVSKGLSSHSTVADPGNMEGGGGGGGGVHQWRKYIRQLGGVGERKLPHRPRSFASYHYCFINNKNCTWDLGTRGGGIRVNHGRSAPALEGSMRSTVT